MFTRSTYAPLFIVLIACSWLMIGDDIQAQNKGGHYSDNAGRHQIGVSAAMLGGVGFSYRQWLPSDYGFQVTLLPYYFRDGDISDTFVSAGVLGLRRLMQGESVDLLLEAGGQILYSANKGPRSDDESDTRFILGAGPAIDVHFWHISVTGSVGLGAIVGEEYFQISPMIGTSLSYYF